MNSRRRIPIAARAAQQFTIGLLDTGLGPYFDLPFTRKLAELGYVEGKNVVIERKSAEGNAELLAGLAADLVRQQVDVIVPAGTPAGILFVGVAHVPAWRSTAVQVA